MPRLVRDTQQEHCPSGVKQKSKDILKAELISQKFTRVKTVEWCWDLQLNHVYVHNTSESMNERFKSLFYDTFGLTAFGLFTAFVS